MVEVRRPSLIGQAANEIRVSSSELRTLGTLVCPPKLGRHVIFPPELSLVRIRAALCLCRRKNFILQFRSSPLRPYLHPNFLSDDRVVYLKGKGKGTAPTITDRFVSDSILRHLITFVSYDPAMSTCP